MTTAAYFKDHEKSVDRQLVADSDQLLPAAIREALDKVLDSQGADRDAIGKIREIAYRDDRYCRELLSALTMSKFREDWAEAERLLPKLGSARQYNRLAFAYWSDGNNRMALELAEHGINRAREHKDADAEMILANSVAYYLAHRWFHEREGSEHANEAKELGKASLKYRAVNPKSREYAESLDTLGFVQIAFGESISEVSDGIEKCKEALSLGSNPLLYQSHVQAYTQRAAQLLRPL